MGWPSVGFGRRCPPITTVPVWACFCFSVSRVAAPAVRK